VDPPISYEAAGEISRLMKLFSHPIRQQILTALAADGPASPTTLSERFPDYTVGDCNYHLSALKSGGVVAIARSRQVRGANERIYRVEPRSAWPFKPRLHPLISYMLPAISSAADPFAVAVPVTLDARGVEDATAATSEVRSRAAKIEAAARSRLDRPGSARAIEAVLAIGFLGGA